MSLISKMFGGGKGKNKGPTPQEAIQKLRETEEMLEKKQAFLEKKIDQEIATAKKNATKNKRGIKKSLLKLIWIIWNFVYIKTSFFFSTM